MRPFLCPGFTAKVIFLQISKYSREISIYSKEMTFRGNTLLPYLPVNSSLEINLLVCFPSSILSNARDEVALSKKKLDIRVKVKKQEIFNFSSCPSFFLGKTCICHKKTYLTFFSAVFQPYLFISKLFLRRFLLISAVKSLKKL